MGIKVDKFILKEFKEMIFFFALLLITLSANAQQYGHLNFGELLSLMPQTEAAEQKLQAYNDSLVANGQTIATNAQQLIEDYQRAVASREESPRQIAAREQAIRDAQETLSGFEYEAQQLLNNRRAKLLEPVVTMANEAAP